MKVLVVALALFAACGGQKPITGTPRAAADPVAVPASVNVDTARKDLVFRYLDPSSGEVATAASVDAIPAAARGQVVVYDPVVPLPAGYDLVADLSKGNTATPRANFAFSTRAAVTPSTETPPSKTADTATKDVVMFSTEGCGYCAKARKYLTENRVPFTELDLDDDPQAPARLSTLGKQAGLSARDMQGVPIIFVGSQPILGWDPNRLASLLGLHG